MPFNLDSYEPVESRIAKFWERHHSGRITTELLSSDAQHTEGLFIVRASVYTGAELRDTPPTATGLACELASKTGVNFTSPLENCETSAIGRALANLGFAAKKSARVSREEMEKVVRMSEPGRTAGDHADAIGGKPGSDHTSSSEVTAQGNMKAPADAPTRSGGDPDSGPVSSRGTQGAGPDTASEGEEVLRKGKPGSNSPSDDNAPACDHEWQDTWVNSKGETLPVHPDYLYCPICKRTWKKTEIARGGVLV